MRIFAILIAVLTVCLLGLLFVVPSLVPSETYRTRIQEQLSTELGRQVELSGDVRLSTFPVIRAKTDGVRVANPEGFTQADLATLKGLEARIRLLPLLSRRVEIASFTLREPVITLEKRADGAVNWTFGEETAETADGPFKRDGRYTQMDPSIRAFNIENGTLRYLDRMSGTDITADAINAFISLPGLSETLIVDGSLRLEDRDMSITLDADSPESFLSGRVTALQADLSVDGVKINVDGAIPAGEDLAFRGEVDGDISDIAALKAFLPDTSYLDAVGTASFRGKVDYAGQAVGWEDGSVSVEGPAGTVSFDGDARYDGAPVLNGRIRADITDMQALKPFLTQDIQGFDRLRTATVDAVLNAEGTDAFSITTAKVSVAGPDVSANYEGTGRYQEDLSLRGRFAVDVSNPAGLAAEFAPDAKGVDMLGPVRASGTLALDGTDYDLTDLTASTDGELLSGRFAGRVSGNGEAVTANGNFDASTPDAGALLRDAATGLDPSLVKDAAVAGAVSAKGSIAYDGTATTITDLVATSQSGVQSSRYIGDVRYAETATLDGRFEADVPSVGALDAALTADLPYSDSLGRVALTGTVSGGAETMTITNIDAAMSEGLLNGSFKGSAMKEGDAIALDGQLEAGGESLRALAAKAGTTLPPSSETGPVFEAFALSGNVGGTTQSLALSDAVVSLDALKGTGRFGVDLAGAKPRLTGTLDVGVLDLRPYMSAYSAQNPTGEIQPWSRDPLPVEGLRNVDADLSLKTDGVKMTRLSTGPSTMTVSVRDGRLSADVPNLSLYGGAGRGTFVLDAAPAVPKVEITAALDQLDSKGFLGALAGFAKTTGTAGTSVSLTGSGRSQAEIMQSLTGAGDFKVVDGSLQGIDAAEFLTGLDAAFSQRRLPGGIGASKVTQFKDLLGKFSMEGGVAKVDRFALSAIGVQAEGEGQLDLGNQTLDFRFRPRATGDTAKGLAAFGVPIRFSGSFGEAKAGLDTDFLGEVIEAKARAEAAKAVQDRIGGPVGGVLGGVLGGGSQTTSAEETATAPETQAQPLESIVGGLLGGQRNTGASETPETGESAQQDPSEEDTDTTTEPETVEDAVLGLFGIRKKKDETK